MGVAPEALECIRASLHTSSVAAREVPFLNAANVLHHAGYLEGKKKPKSLLLVHVI